MSFYDVSDPRNPKLLGDWLNPGGLTHGMEMDDSYVYVCGTAAESKKDIQVEELNILNYDTPSKPELVSRFHIVGQHVGEEFGEANRKNPNGSDQMITCHEIQKDNDRLYLAYRDEGVVILDITDPDKAGDGSMAAMTTRRLSTATRACRGRAAAPAPTR